LDLGAIPVHKLRVTLMPPHLRLPRIALTAVLAAVSVMSCDSEPSGPTGSGTFFVTVTSPNGTEGAAVLSLAGGIGLGEVASTAGDVFVEHGADAIRIVVILDQPGQIRFTVRADDVGSLPNVVLVQVAGGDNQLRASLNGYDVEVAAITDASPTGSRRSP